MRIENYFICTLYLSTHRSWHQLALQRPADFHLVLMSVTRGIAAALSAPLFEAVGFLEFERHWRDGRGSAFSLNLFKCNVSSVGFLFMIWLERMGSMGNLPSPNPFSALYLEHEPPKFYESMERQRGPFLRKTQGSTTNQKRNDFVPILLDLTQQKFTEEEHTQPFNNLHNNNQPESPRLENIPNQGYPAQNVIVVGQGDSMHNTASQIGYSELHHPYVEGNTPQSNRFYSMNTKAIQQYAPGLELRSENEYFQDHVHEKRWCFYRSYSCTFGSFVSTWNIYR